MSSPGTLTSKGRAKPMPTKRARITRKEMRAALARSGYLLEARVEARLRETGYMVDSNLFYPDPETGKQREYDLRALAAEMLAEPPLEDAVWHTLIIECVNNPQPLAFLAKTSDAPRFHANDIPVVGIPSALARAGSTTIEGLSQCFAMAEYHHYCNEFLATQFCSFQPKKNDATEWMALHDEEHFLSFKKLTDSLEADARQFEARWLPGEHEPVNLTFYYPVMVVQNGMVRVDAAGSRVRLSEVERVLFRRSLVADGNERTYFIDVVTERAFPGLLADIEREMRETATRMRARLPALRAAAESEAGRRRLAALRQDVANTP